MTFLGLLSLLLITLKLMGIISITWFIAFLPIIIMVIFWVFIFIANIVFISFVNKGMKKGIKRFEHDKRFEKFDDEFQKAKSDYELHEKEFKEKLNRLKGGMK
ncbi:hypothetical protein [Streptococcus parauberis]|uniref:hypothetical protein n=1 Tax=Streptococcus parauberis TaxID=1348 RepID=UPI0002DAAAE9|nr:hypothetical protein [Streptococcus parauberis]QBX17868.1 hypothetical protein Javan383_0023 [Streptococcus phage Javan383]UWM90190.1 hypothetical protein N2A94_06730 [Streptococcus parauberis]